MIRLENNAAAAAEADLAHVGRGCLSLLAKTTQSSRVTLLKERTIQLIASKTSLSVNSEY